MTARKKVVFWIFTLSLPFFILGSIEALLRLTDSGAGQADDPFLRIDSPRSIFTKVSEGGREYYRVTHPEAYRGRRTSFPVIKGNDTLRIFLLGGSASAGWPHPVSETYGAYLRQALRASFPDRNIEIINVSAHGFASYRVRYIFDDVIHYDPDLLVIYSGNNEFLERRRYADLSVLGWSLYDVRDRLHFLHIFRYVERALEKGVDPRSVLSGKGIMIPNVNLLSSKIDQEVLELRSDPHQYRLVQAHYRFNIEHMVKGAYDRGIPVLLLTVPSNLRDWKPNVSFNRLIGSSLEQWRQWYRSAQKSLLEKDYDAAIRFLRLAIQQEPLHAESYFMLAQSQYAKDDLAGAYANFMKAKELDYNPFRALAAFNESLREIAQAMPNVTLVDLEKRFAESSKGGVPGFDLFLDYVHPTQRGNLVIAEAVFDAIATTSLKGSLPAPSFQHHADPYYGPGQAYDEHRDIKLQAALLYVYAAMHQYKGLIQKARLIEEHYAQQRDWLLQQLATRHARGQYLKVSKEQINKRYEVYHQQAAEVLAIFPAYQKLQVLTLTGRAMEPAAKKEILHAFNSYYAGVKKGYSPAGAN